MIKRINPYLRLLRFLLDSKRTRFFCYSAAGFLHFLLLLLFTSQSVLEPRILLLLHWPISLLIAAFLGSKRGAITALILAALTPLFLQLQGVVSIDGGWVQLQLFSAALSILFALPLGGLRALTLEQGRLNHALETFARIDPETELVSQKGLRAIGVAEFKKATRLNDDISFFLQNEETPTGREDNRRHKRSRKLCDYLGSLSCAIVAPHNIQSLRKLYGRRIEDELIIQIAKRASKSAHQRDTDVIARGEDGQLILLMPGTSARNALVPVHKLVERLSRSGYRLGNKTVNILFNAGVTQLSEHDIALDDLLERAQQAVQAAQQGKGGELFQADCDVSPFIIAQLSEPLA